MSQQALGPVGAGAPQTGPEFDLDLGEYLRRLRRHWKVVAAIIVAMLAFHAARYKMTPKVYEARARIQIKRINVSSLSGGAGLFMENWWNLEYYPTQYKLLESRGLAEDVVRLLRLQDDPKFNQEVVAQEGEAASADADDAVIGKIAQRLGAGLQVIPIRKTQLVDLVYRSDSPEFAMRAANAFAEAFIAMGVKERARATSTASTFLDVEIDRVKAKIAAGQQKLQEFNRSQNVVALDPNSNITRSSLSSISSDYSNATAQRIEKEARYRQLQSMSKEALADTVVGGAVDDARAELSRLRSEYQTKLQTYKEGFPAMVELKTSIDQRQAELTRLIDEQASVVLQNAYAALQTDRNRELQLKREIDRLTSTAIDEQSAVGEYKGLQVELANDEKLLNQLLSQQSDTSVSANMGVRDNLNVDVIDRALLPRFAILPSLRRSVSLGLLTGTLFGILAVFLIEFFDRSIKSSEEVERLLNLPVLSVIPDISYGRGVYGYYYGKTPKGPKAQRNRGWTETKKGIQENPIELLPFTQPRLAISEAYRSLRTALLLSSAEQLKVVTVTSAETGEGKTTTATNLAVVMAQLGRRVLLVDADLRKPRLHKIFKTSNRKGLVSLLTRGAEVGQEVYRPTMVDNLHLLSSGPTPPNPAELLASNRMFELVQYLKKTFDFVIIDTTPALAVTDATLVGAMSDGVLLCLRSGKLQREDAKACANRLQMADVRILGTVLNRYRSTPGRYGKHYRTYEAYAEPSESSDEEDLAATDSAA